MLRKLLVICFFCSISNYSFAHFEETWKDTTPNGKYLYFDEGGNNGIEYLCDTIKIIHVSKWYFYKGFTLGIIKKDSLTNTFFASDEVNNKIYQFNDEKSWKVFLYQNNLNPIFTRWHNTFWSMFPILDSSLNFIWVFFLFIGIILIVVTILIVSFLVNLVTFFLNQSETKFSIFIKIASIIWKIIWKSTLFLWIPLFIINYLLGAFPQSF
jgi:hypothetical protein